MQGAHLAVFLFIYLSLREKKSLFYIFLFISLQMSFFLYLVHKMKKD